MREIDFLPRWYRRAARARRLILAQACATVVIGLGLCAWVGAVLHDVAARRVQINGLEAQLQSRQTALNELTDRRRAWDGQVQRVNELGLERDAARVMHAIHAAKPPGVSLVDLKIDAGAHASTQPSAHHLLVTLQGVAPSDDALATFLTKLSAVPFFDTVTTHYVKPSPQGGQCDFELAVVSRF